MSSPKCEVCPKLNHALDMNVIEDATEKVHFWATMQPMRMLLMCHGCMLIINAAAGLLGVKTSAEGIAGMCLEPINLPGQSVPSVCVIRKGHDGDHRPHL